MKTTRHRYAAVTFGVVIATTCVWVAGCAGLTPLSEVLDDDESETQSPMPTDTPTPTATASGTSGGGSGDGDDRERVNYIWSLPPDPETPTFNDDSAYEALFRDDCDSAAELITRTATSSPNYGAWTSPRAVVFTAAGVAYCRGEAATGAALARQAIASYGTEGLGPADTPWCKLYRALQSVIEQQPADAFECRGAWQDGPDFRTGADTDGSALYDDPLTAADESVPPPPPETPSEPGQSPSPSPSPAEPSRPDEPPPGSSDE
jgi:hypothetical protein